MTCPQCGMHYNATDYTECPYCANGMTTKAAAKKKRRWWGREAAGSAPEAKQAPPAPQAPPKRPDPVREAPVQKAPEVQDLHHTVSYEAALTDRPALEMAPERLGSGLPSLKEAGSHLEAPSPPSFWSSLTVSPLASKTPLGRRADRTASSTSCAACSRSRRGSRI